MSIAQENGMTELSSTRRNPANRRVIRVDGARNDPHGTSVALLPATMLIEGGVMRRISFVATNLFVLALSFIALSGVAYPCSAVRSSARVDLFTCPCPDGNAGELQNPIYVVTGTISLTNRRAAPTLGNIVVELDGKQKSKYVPVARQVLDEAGHSIVNTCEGTFAAGPIAGRIVLTDDQGNELTFAQVKNLPEGTVTLHYVATFAGLIPEITPGSRIRVRTVATFIGADSPKTCSVDADGNGSIDNDVRTLVLQKVVKVPATAAELTP